MAASKEKMIRVLEILRETDEAHPLTASQIVDKLDRMYGIEAEKKSVCRDIRTLTDCGYDIILHQDNKLGYYLGSREFEDWELKVLMDAVQSARFLTESQTNSLVAKLKNQAGADSRRTLELVNISTAVKRGDLTVKFAIDRILQAMRKHQKVHFDYVCTNDRGEEVKKHAGGTLPVSPFALCWRDDRYFLIANYSEEVDLSYYRLDRIRNLTILEKQRSKPLSEVFPKDPEGSLRDFINRNVYNRKGEKVRLGLRVAPGKADEIRDSFGPDVRFIPEADGTLTAYMTLAAGEGLYRWLLEHASDATVIKPESVREELVKRIRNMLCQYEN